LVAPTYAETLDTFMVSLRAAPLLAPLSTLGAAASITGQCPTPSFQAFGQTFTFELHCQLWQQVEPLLAPLMLLLWGIYAFFILFSA
jgi:hypothetical protein